MRGSVASIRIAFSGNGASEGEFLESNITKEIEDLGSVIDMLEGPGTVERELPAKFVQFKRYGIDISKEPMLVYPTLHYQNEVSRRRPRYSV